MRLMILLSILLAGSGQAFSHSAAFFYGKHVPIQQLALFNTVVVEPSYVPTPPKTTKHSQWFAYVSVGEVNPQRWYAKQIKPQWIRGNNAVWHTKILDQSNPQWQQFFVNTVIKKLWQAGYRGFFLDTIDAYQLVATSSAEKIAQQQGLIHLIKLIKQHYPTAKLLLNRGFELLPKLHQEVMGVVAESLYQSYNFHDKKYQAVKRSDQQWLLAHLNQAKKQGFKVFVIDYLPPQAQQQARADAKKIASHGFIPWVSDIDLNSMGVSTIHLLPRNVMLIYSSKEAAPKSTAQPFMYLSMPLNYLGYVPKLYDVEKPLPAYPLKNRVAGIVIWLHGVTNDRRQALGRWIKKALAQKIPLTFLGDIGYLKKIPGLLTQLQLNIPRGKEITSKLRVSNINRKLIGFEAQPVIDPLSFIPLIAKKATILLQVKDANNQREDVAAITSWGGYALAPSIIYSSPKKQHRYILNPFRFLQQALRLSVIPIPDVTTENGRRILISHIDGDGFISRSEWSRGPYSGESLLRTVLSKYHFPITISIIEGEIGDKGLMPEASTHLMAIARAIFKLPWVEIANHSYSHPFDWAAAYQNRGKLTIGDHLPIPNYRFNLSREIVDSTHFINNQLAPPSKKCKVFLWTGDTTPPNAAVKMTYEIGLLNMNGGNTRLDKSLPSLTYVSGLGVYKGNYLQVFAPIQNENIYTNGWTGPFYGFKRVIETFKMTDQPRRLKPIDIYYHFYSASKVSALKALDSVYQWVARQKVTPEFSSTYIKKVLDYYQLTMAKQGDAWLIHGNGSIREFRLPQTQGYPTLNDTVIGFNQVNHNHYIHTDSARYHQVSMQKKLPKQLYLHDSNALLSNYRHRGSNFQWHFRAVVPLIARFSNGNGCQLRVDNKKITLAHTDSLLVVNTKKGNDVEIQATCR